jgi:hypothetical protein
LIQLKRYLIKLLVLFNTIYNKKDHFIRSGLSLAFFALSVKH